MATDEDAKHDDSAAEKFQSGTGNRGSSYARNSIDGSSIANSVQAYEISGGIHFYGVNPPSIYASQAETVTGGSRKQEEPSEPEAREPGVISKYFDHTIKNRSPVLVWSALMAPLNMAIVGMIEYLVGARMPGESPSADLETAQAGTFFSVIAAVFVTWRYIARRNGSNKWGSLREVHPQIVKFLRSRILAILVVSLLVLLIVFTMPTLMNPESLTTATSNTASDPSGSGLSDFGFAAFLILLFIEVAIFCAYVNIRHSGGDEPSVLD